MGYRVAVVGATGAVGHEMLSILSEREFAIDEIHALASNRSEGKEINFGDKKIKVRNLENFDFSSVDIALFSAGSSVSEKWAPIAGKKGCIVIDNTSFFRMDPEVPLIVPEVNPQDIEHFRNKNIISNPNCSTIQMVVALKPLNDLSPIKRVVVSTYQSVSGAGKSAMDELWNQTRKMFFNEEYKPKHFSKRISYNVIPHIDSFSDDGYTGEELKMVNETKKILGQTIEVVATCVRVPVFIGHSESINIEFESHIQLEEVYEALRSFDGISVIDDIKNNKYVTPIDCVGDYSVFISRIREDHTIPFGLNIWVVSDNLRKGAALNSVQIAEELITRGYV
tara:strand:- start:1528 stop:2541 length:1014 start_codon:yes stop_codon:yes gene_type:complete